MGAVIDEDRWCRLYPCLALPEKAVLAFASGLRQGILLTILASPVDVFASVLGLDRPPARYEQFKRVYGLTRRSVTIGDEVIDFYELDGYNFNALRDYLESSSSNQCECATFKGKWAA